MNWYLNCLFTSMEVWNWLLVLLRAHTSYPATEISESFEAMVKGYGTV